MKLLSLMMLTLMLIGQVFATENFAEVDIRYYYAKKRGLKDLSFTIRKPGLLKFVQESFHIKNINDVYLQVFWKAPDQYVIDVLGIPNGFFDLKQNIKAMIRPYIEYVLPHTFEERFGAYSFERQDSKEANVIVAKDKTYKNAIPELKFFFTQENILTKLEANTPQGFNVQTFDYFKPGWSDGKNVLNSFTNNYYTPYANTTIKQDLSYKKIDGYGFPVEVKISYTVDRSKSAPANTKKKELKKYIQRSSEKIIFGNFKVNKQVAQNRIFQEKKNVQ